MYRVRQDGSLKSQGEIRAMYPNTSFPKVWTPELVEELGLDPVFETPTPETTRYQTASKSGVEQDANGNWVWKWVLGPVFSDTTDMEGNVTTAAEHEAAYIAMIDGVAAAQARAQRDKLLAETDWRFRSDLTPSQQWVDYCQALRDVPEQAGFPHNIEWPAKPE